MSKKVFDICFGADNNYIEQLSVSIVSILQNSLPDEFFRFYILTDALSDENKKRLSELKKIKDFEIDIIVVDKKDFESCPLLSKIKKDKKDYHVTLPTYFRFKIASLFPQISKLLYFDCDIISRKSLSKLFATDIKGHYCAMVLDAESDLESSRLGTKKYFNAGVMLLNLDLWREENVEQKLFDYSKKHYGTILWQDQDVINAVFDGKIKEIDNAWNFQFLQYNSDNYDELLKKYSKSSVLHLAGRFKPWLLSFEHPVFNEYFYYLQFTPFYKNILNYKCSGFGKFLENNLGGNGKLPFSLNKIFDRKLTDIHDNLVDLYSRIEKLNYDDEINSLYGELDKNYAFTEDVAEQKRKELRNELTKIFDTKIDELYLEINKNYAFTEDFAEQKRKELRNELTDSVDKKISRVYQEITNNYEYTKELTKQKQEELRAEFSSGINEKTEKLAQDINDKLELLIKPEEEKQNELKKEICSHFDEKTEKINQNIAKNYLPKQDFSDLFKAELTPVLNEKTNRIYQEINDRYESTKDLVRQSQDKLWGEFNSDIDTKIHEIYLEITKNYEFTKELSNQKQDELREEIAKNLDNARKIAEEKSVELRNELDNYVAQNTQKLDELHSQTKQVCDEIFDRISSENKEIKEILNSLKTKINENTENMFSEFSKFYAEYDTGIVGRFLDFRGEIEHDIVNTKYELLKSETQNLLKENSAVLQNAIKRFDEQRQFDREQTNRAIKMLKNEFEKKFAEKQQEYEEQISDLKVQYDRKFDLLSPMIGIFQKLKKVKNSPKKENNK